ncbi:DUF2004 domain-containing protein [Moraxella bovis]|uniref:DUF2004 domain-containing protein n=1 Tax=Moraxella bovis TaxID=476 RepID=UPI00099446BD|nr:DUF2004 domain-containing protein [Moraxella bovis]OOR92547.1 hypothetical protein B0182_00640 [Moraxella bovis]UZA17577.1 DUF2004 domain-containing protein [Moraxella bovis]
MTTHSYFGELNFDNLYIWENEIHIPQINENPIEILLWVDDKNTKPTIEFLDKSANHFQNIDKLHQKAVIELVNYLNDDDYFVNYYVDEIDEYDLPTLTALIENDDLTNENFVKLLKLQSVSSWYGEDCQIVMDYMIDPEQSDQILAVKFDLDGNFNKVSWES